MEANDFKNYVESSDYYKDARAWYNTKYLLPLSHRIWLFYISLLSILMLLALSININNLLPIKQQLTYAINIPQNNTSGETNARVVSMDGRYNNNPYRFIASNLLESYVTNRENFNYFNLTKQFEYVQNASTRIVYKAFSSYMSVNNPESPVMRYQQYAKRTINVNGIKFISDKEAIVNFNSIAKDSSNAIFENLSWSAQITFEMGDVGKHLPSESNFKFTVTNYNLKLLGDAK